MRGVGWELELVSGTRRQYCSALMLNKCLIKPALHGVQHKCLINVSLRTNKSDKAAVYHRYGSHICCSTHSLTSSSETTSETTLRDYSRWRSHMVSKMLQYTSVYAQLTSRPHPLRPYQRPLSKTIPETTLRDYSGYRSRCSNTYNPVGCLLAQSDARPSSWFVQSFQFCFV